MDKKRLIMIAGPAGIGKTVVCKELFKNINGSAWLDADWCWMVNPYPGKTPEQKTYSEKAFGYILDGYFNDCNTHTVLFCWLMHSDFMFKLVTDRILYTNYDLIKISLVCDEQEHIRRLIADNRREEQIMNHDSMKKYRALDAHIIDTTNLTIKDTVNRILLLIK